MALPLRLRHGIIVIIIQGNHSASTTDLRLHEDLLESNEKMSVELTSQLYYVTPMYNETRGAR